jgi:hypothetical protein
LTQKGWVSEKTYHGSCDCEKVRFEVKLDLAAGTGKCNCTTCTKKRWWGANVKPEAFRFHSGESELTNNAFDFGPKGYVHHLFCRHCGVQPLIRGHIAEVGGPYVSINLGALDDLNPEEWANAPVRYMDGRHDDWFHQPAHIRHL